MSSSTFPTLLNGEIARAWIRELLDAGTLVPGRSFVLSPSMIAEGILLGKRGTGVITTGHDEETLGRFVKETRSRGVEDVQTARGDLFSIKPQFLGRVDCVAERNFLPFLGPIQRADWAHHIARLLPRRGALVGLFPVGVGGGASPSESGLMKLLGRHFTTEAWREVEGSPPGEDRVFRGFFLRK